MLTRHILKDAISMLLICAITLTLVSCSTNQENINNKDGVVISPYESSNAREGNTTFTFSATTNLTRESGRIESNLVVEDLTEQIDITFGQSGKNRKIIMHIYYDFLPVNFKAGEKGVLDNKFQFDLKDKTEISIPIFLDPDIIIDKQAHKLVFVFTPGYNEYAKDQAESVIKPSICKLYQLHFGEYIESPNLPKSKYPLDIANDYYKHSHGGLILNTDISNLNADKYTGVANPEKIYSVSSNEEFKLNYVVDNISIPAKTALIYLTLGNQVIDINVQNYLWIDLKKSPLSVGELTFTTPKEAGLYDIIGYVVYDPFEPISNPEQAIPHASVRFTIEVK